MLRRRLKRKLSVGSVFYIYMAVTLSKKGSGPIG